MQTNIFELTKPKYKITKPIRLIELFAGIGSQAKALKNIGANFEHYRVIEFDEYAIASYNAIHGTNFEPLDITKITAKDLGIVETDKYDYIMTYSFPCQDLSVAGKGAGMKKGSGTRSGLLWEVEYLLSDLCGFKEHRVPPRNSKYLSIAEWVDDYNYDIDKSKLPQILLMENVPQVIGKKNIQDFHKWQLFLEKLGYSNYIELLNAKDYEMPQNRNRCFMVSVLGDYYYEFPRKRKLKLRLKDMLEDEVDEKYYLSDKQIEQIESWNAQQKPLEVAKSRDDEYIQTITAKGNTSMNASMLLIKEAIKQGAETICINSKVDGKQPSLQDRVYDSAGISTAITTSFMPSIIIPEKTKKGYAIAHAGDGVYIDRPHQKRGVVQKGMIQTLKTSGDDVGVVVKNNIKNINDENNVFSTLGTNCGSSTSVGGGVVVVSEPTIAASRGRNPQNPSDRTTGIPTKQRLEINSQGLCNTLTTVQKDNYLLEPMIINSKGGNTEPKVHTQLRIRKLTPLECWRLMGFDDEDFEKAENVNSNSQLYKQAGNSIVVNVLEKIFKNLF